MAGRTSLKTYAHVWWRNAGITFALAAQQRADFFMYVGGKLIRMAFFFVFAFSLFSKSQEIAGYSKHAVLLFFGTMNIIDVISQLLWRGLTTLPRAVKQGGLDMILKQPINPLFYIASGLFDFWDLTTLPAAIAFLVYAFNGLTISAPQIILWAAMVLLGLTMSLATAIIIGSISFWTTNLENLYWLYRDLVYATRFPPSVFPSVLRFGFTFIVPIFVITAFPAQAFLGKLSHGLIAWAVTITVFLCVIAAQCWRAGLRKYVSASS